VAAGGAALETVGAVPTFTVRVCCAFGVTPFARSQRLGRRHLRDDPEMVAVPLRCL